LVIDWTRRRVCRRNSLTIGRINASLCFATRPLIGLQYRIEIGMRNGPVPVHQFFNRQVLIPIRLFVRALSLNHGQAQPKKLPQR